MFTLQAVRKIIVGIVNIIYDYSPVMYEVDWDLLVFEYFRQGRECIVPEVTD